MALHHLPSAATIGRLINDRDYRHKLAMVVLVPDDLGSWSLAVANVSTGEVLAWDGVYPVEEPIPEKFARPLMDYAWNDWDDMPSKLILNANAYWLGVIIHFLMPSYSVDICASRALINWHGDAEPLNGQSTVAYYPCNVEHVIAEVQKERDHLASNDFKNLLERQDLLLTQLRAL